MRYLHGQVGNRVGRHGSFAIATAVNKRGNNVLQVLGVDGDLEVAKLREVGVDDDTLDDLAQLQTRLLTLLKRIADILCNGAHKTQLGVLLLPPAEPELPMQYLRLTILDHQTRYNEETVLL